MPVEVIDTLKQLIETAENGQRGFAEGAEKLSKDGHPAMAAKFAGYSRQRALFATELRAFAPELDSAARSGGTVTGAVHRGWLALKDAVNGNDPHGVLDAAEQGEDHALSDYSAALKTDLPAAARVVVERQYGAIREAHDTVKSLRDQN